MSVLGDYCEPLRRALLEDCKQCQVLHDEVSAYQSIVSTLPLALVELTLQVLGCEVLALEACLRKAHQEKGVVFVMMDKAGLDIKWTEKEFSEQDKDWFKGRGFLILSPEELCEMIHDLVAQLESGQWAEAVKFINQYRIFLESEFSKIG